MDDQDRQAILETSDCTLNFVANGSVEAFASA